jgi:hypothetical protein
MDNTLKDKLIKVLTCASNVVLSRDGDVSTEEGYLATCQVDDIIYLEEALVELLNLPCDEVSPTVFRHITLLESEL